MTNREICVKVEEHEMFEHCETCEKFITPWRDHTDPLPWDLRSCDHKTEKGRRPVEDLMADPCWTDRENSLDYSPRFEFWSERGKAWRQERLEEG